MKKAFVGAYRYGFNGKELDNEMFGLGNELDYGMRVYDPRAGRFLSVDPLTKSYPELTPYQYASNSPIENSDLDGLESISETKVALARQWGTQIKIKESFDKMPKPMFGTWYSSYQTAPSYLTPQPIYSPRETEKRELALKSYRRSKGFNEDGSKPPLMRLAENETFNKFAENIALPAVDIVSLAYGGAELRALMKMGSKTPSLFKVDLMGGPHSKLGKDWINYDLEAVEGIRASVADFSKFFKKGSISEMVNNPQAPFLNEVKESLAKGSTITIRGQEANSHFSSVFNVDKIEGYEILGRRTGLSKEGYHMTNGAPLRGGDNSIKEIILVKN